MGKVRIKTLGDMEAEEQQKKKLKERREHKKTAKAPGLKGGERVVAVGPSVEELEKESPQQPRAASVEDFGEPKKAKPKRVRKKVKSQRYRANASIVSEKTTYPIDRAIALLKKFKTSRFDETVELHVNVKERGVSGQVTLPHGTGKKVRVEVAQENNIDSLVSDIEKGEIDFDVLVAHPSVMSKLAKVARILGPKGLMPNPKNGTITEKLEEAVKKLASGQVHFKTEPQAPIIHLSVGKLSLGEKEIQDNIQAAVLAIGSQKIEKATLKSTMSPGIKLDVSSL